MGLFDSFKRKEELSYNPADMKVTDLDKGFMLDYDLKTWEVTAVYMYDYGNNFFTKEYKLDSGDDSCFLEVEQDDELHLTIVKKIKVTSVAEDLPETIIGNKIPPQKLVYNGITFLREKESPGYFKDLDNPDEEGWTEFIAWDYYDEQNKNILCIEQWGEREFEASFGKVAKEYEISSIIPSEKKNVTPNQVKKNNWGCLKYIGIGLVCLILLIIIGKSCGDGSSSYTSSSSSGSSYKTNPVDELIKEMNAIPDYSIILFDMDADGTFSKTYKHRYQVLVDDSATGPKERKTDWYPVDEAFFNQNLNNMGMEIASKKDGVVKKSITPPGYSNYVGNAKYGNWRTRSDGTSFWEFYGKYAMFRDVLGMASRPVYRSYYDDYRRSDYNRPYYGPSSSSGGSYYGTNSSYNKTNQSSSSWFSKASNQTFKDQVRNRVQRSSSSSSSGDSKVSRSSSRYSSGSSSSSSRSRSGGFGK